MKPKATVCLIRINPGLKVEFQKGLFSAFETVI